MIATESHTRETKRKRELEKHVIPERQKNNLRETERTREPEKYIIPERQRGGDLEN